MNLPKELDKAMNNNKLTCKSCKTILLTSIFRGYNHLC